MFQFRVSVIVPVYNQVPYIDRCMESLLGQTIDPKDMEIVLVDDGSTDESPAMLDRYAEKYDNVFVIHQKNAGLSGARNTGIDNSHGKYLMFLDSDDYFESETVEAVADFFDQHYDEVDLVTYPSKTIRNGEEGKAHYRYGVYTKSGVYDLTDPLNIYGGVTRIEVCVKNTPGHNTYFSFDREFRQEDQKYCIDVVLPKLKVGFCDKGGYVYEPNADGLQSSTFFSYYLFERCTAFWEEEFAKFPDGPVPQYLQALFVNDVAWKTTAGILLPYHYSEEKFAEAKQRIANMLARCDSSVIINHPGPSDWMKNYLLRFSDTRDCKLFTGSDRPALVIDDVPFLAKTGIQVLLNKTVVREDGVVLRGVLRDCVYSYCEKPKLYACLGAYDENQFGAMERIELPLRHTRWDHFGSKEKTGVFWAFEYFLSKDETRALCFKPTLGGREMKTAWAFNNHAIFSNKGPRRQTFVYNDYRCSFSNGVFTMEKSPKSEYLAALKKGIAPFLPKQQRTFTERLGAKLLNKKPASAVDQIDFSERIWLYHDCHGVKKNNAYDQFRHDCQKKDGIKRYYIVNDELSFVEELFSPEEMANQVVQFQSDRHKELFLRAEKIITAYAEKTNYLAFEGKDFKKVAHLFHAEIVYLQHGILHAHQPWKYSIDRLHIDREVVSTQFEIDNLTQNYDFKEDELIPAGMPRYDHIDKTRKPSNKILFAPSWRKYVVAQKPDGQWAPKTNAFLGSSFYKEMNRFFASKELADLLERYDYTIEVKLHPILFELYGDLLDFSNPRIVVADATVDDAEYKVFITDFSSYRFDFVYLNRAIMYFFPDEEQFRSGMCDYRETDLPLDGQFGDMAVTVEEALEILEGILENDGMPKEEYAKQMDSFFLHDDFKQRERIYKALI